MVRASSKASRTPTGNRLTRASLVEGADVLRRRDRRLGSWIERIGNVSLRRQRSHFVALCRSIIAQQLASAAAATIFARFAALFEPDGKPTPEAVLGQSQAKLRACGLSQQKIRYLLALATAFADGDLACVRVSTLADEEVSERLTQVPGIGVWTAEMFMIFALGRLDVFSVGDLALRNAVQRVEGKELSKDQILKVAERWSPYRSVASLYLWRVAHWPSESSDKSSG